MVELQKLRLGVDVPELGTIGSAAYDLRAFVYEPPLKIYPGQTLLVPTGIAISINDPTIAAVILPRSGMGHRRGLVLGNLVGLIDSDYQGEIMVSLWNRSSADTPPHIINHGDRIAQLMFIHVVPTQFDVVSEFSQSTERGAGGFGHTGDK